MFLKRKIDLLKKSLFLCLFLILGSFAATLNAAEKAKFIINDAPFIFRNQKFIQGKQYTPQKLQEKVGKAYGVGNKAKLLEIFYTDEGLVFTLDRQNYFCGLEFFIKVIGIYFLNPYFRAVSMTICICSNAQNTIIHGAVPFSFGSFFNNLLQK